jgi:nucleoside phosphorylase
MRAKILVVAAWAPEIAALRGSVRDRSVSLRAVGVGLVDAAAGAARAIAETSPEAIVLVGTAGVYPGAAPVVGSVVVARRLVLGCPGVAGGAAYLPAPMTAEVETSGRLRRALAGGTPLVDVACPLAITRGRAVARRLREATGCAVENLEAFAVARAAGRIPFAAVLGIANEVGPAAHRQWKAHGAAAAAAACDVVLRWIKAPTRR